MLKVKEQLVDNIRYFLIGEWPLVFQEPTGFDDSGGLVDVGGELWQFSHGFFQAIQQLSRRFRNAKS